ncbi:MAG: response regulator transcription factor [Myxococcales bacterium]|nr:response regulator transcription factor [Myxococcales bacterium]
MRILIVEDEPQARERFQRAVASLASATLLAASCAEARPHLATTPDLLLTDLGLPDGDGVSLIKEASTRGIPSLVITVFGDERRVMEAIEAGASGYLLKDGGTQDVAKAVSDVLAGGAPISPRIAKYLLRRLQPAPGNTPEVELTAREAEVLGLIAKGFTYAEIGEVLALSTHTVGSHVRKIYRKLAVTSRGEAVFEAMQLGLLGRE